MTVRTSANLAFLAFIVALTNLGAADQTSEIFAGGPASLTRPDKSGHPLPEGEGRNTPAQFSQTPVNEREGRKVPAEISGPPVDDAWRARINEQLNESITRLQSNDASEPSGMVVIDWGGGGGDASQPPSAVTSVRAEGEETPAMVARLLQEHGLPPGLTSVVAVESAFNPLALSPKGARGLWQLMPATARRYGLTVAPHVDERTDPVKSTRAAAAYMKDLFTQFRDWPLALAAYNAGEDRVARAMTRIGARDFWTLRRHAALPEETLQYVPAVLEKLESPLHAPGTEPATSSDAPGQSESPAGRIAYAKPAGHAEQPPSTYFADFL